MKTNLYCITTKKEIFHVSAPTLSYAVDKAYIHIDINRTIGVEPPAIIEVKFIGLYADPQMPELKSK